MASFQERETKPFKGIRMRKWGRWVSEIRIPGSRTRIWLGSYDSPDKAARAYDAALFCLHGARGRFNFPDETRPAFSDEQRRMLSKADIKAVAALFASSSLGNDPMPLPQPGNDPLPLPPPGNDPLPPPPAIPAPPPPIADGTWPELAAGQDGSSLDPFLDVVYGSPMTYNLDEFLLREASAPGTWGFPSVHG